jgi:hypothetical protein
VPRLQHKGLRSVSSHTDSSGLGSRLAAGPPGLAFMAIFHCHFFVNLTQASWLLLMNDRLGDPSGGKRHALAVREISRLLTSPCASTP